MGYFLDFFNNLIRLPWLTLIFDLNLYKNIPVGFNSAVLIESL